MDRDMQRRVERFRRLNAEGIFPDPQTMGYGDERERRRDAEAARLAKHGEVDVDMGDLVGRVTMVVSLRGVEWAERRLRVAMWVFRFGVWVAGFGGVEFEAVKEQEK